MRGNGSSWVVQPISCLQWQSAGWFDQSAGWDQLLNQSRLASAAPPALSQPKHGKIQLSGFKVLFIKDHNQMDEYGVFDKYNLDPALCHFCADFALLRRQNAPFPSA